MPTVTPPVLVCDRTLTEWQPVTITTQEWSLLYATPSEPVELYDPRTDPVLRRSLPYFVP